ncbi:CHC2 zinc finger domain-containing protein [Labrys portucalensis]|uniref:CHC2 zinc finger domain-containing protein n=1 Tax=Labrys neptuniae TaxID=376174 RepID=A0ABV6ZJW7_9HYPH
MIDDAAFREWIGRARDADLVTEVEKRGVKLGKGHERAGPCPIEGKGRDRFAVNVRKKIWSCRGCDTGGDVIKFVMMASGVDFVGACEILAGEPPPRGRALTEEDREAIAQREAEKEREAAAERKRKEAEAERYREEERERLYRLWKQGRRELHGTPVAYYLDARGIPQTPATADLRFHPEMRYYVPGKRDPLHTGPAMIAAITGPDHRFRGLHITYLTRVDGVWRKFSPGLDPDGEPWPAKKVRGSKAGNCIVLRSVPEPRRLFAGEGIETVLSVWYALARSGQLGDGDFFLSTVDLGNMAGRPAEAIAHPTERTVDAKGRHRARKVPGPVPDLNSQAFSVPVGTKEVCLLGDGDSDRFATSMAIQRAATRISKLFPMVEDVRCAMADDGEDFNDMLEGVA